MTWEQGFRKERSTTEQTFLLRNIIVQVVKGKSSLYQCFVEHEKALDSLNRALLWKIMKCYRIPPKIVTMVGVHWMGIEEQACSR